MSLEDGSRLQRNTSTARTTAADSATPPPAAADDPTSEKPLIRTNSIVPLLKPRRNGAVPTLIRSIASIIPACRRFLTHGHHPSLGRRVTGTLFGPKRGHVTFAVQEEPRADPVLLLELATPTAALVREMSSGLLRIALECERGGGGAGARRLFQEPVWTMYCNGRKSGYAVSRACGELDRRVLGTVQAVSIGAGVIPPEKDDNGELMYMRARFERVVGSRDSEAFYMLNPDGGGIGSGSGGPELSIFLLRV